MALNPHEDDYGALALIFLVLAVLSFFTWLVGH